MLTLNTAAWFETAPCRGDNKVFFSAHPSKRKTAIEICNNVCQHRAECLQFAIDNKMSIGVWGGKTGPELSRLLDGVES